MSLPLAFLKTGNLFVGPLMLIVTAIITEFVFRIHVGSARIISPAADTETKRGNDSFESVASAAFGPNALFFSKALVTSMCFFGTVGYAVLLRDMLQPVTDIVWNASETGPTLKNNLTMLTVVLLVTPLCTLKTLTSLERFGAASMFSILILGSCVLFRSVECNLGILINDAHFKGFKLFPDSWKDVLDVFPLFVSCYVCHYNLVPVQNELRQPSAKRVSWWLRSTAWSATIFYLVIGLSGSAYSHCTSNGQVHGNILLDFPEDDPLVLVGRFCLAVTITLAFPMLTIPARDILIRSLPRTAAAGMASEAAGDDANAQLREPLLEAATEQQDEQDEVSMEASLTTRLVLAVVVFWSAAAVASCVSSIDVVWDLLGSSLSILLSFLIPCGSYLVIVHKYAEDGGPHDLSPKRLSMRAAGLLIVLFVPLMFLSTGNAIYNTFFRK